MNTCAFLLLLAVQIYAEGIEGPTGKEPFLPVFESLRTWEAMHPSWRVLHRYIDPEKGCERCRSMFSAVNFIHRRLKAIQWNARYIV